MRSPWPVFWLLTVRNAVAAVWGGRVHQSSVARTLLAWHPVPLAAVYVLVVILIAVEFWTYWSTLL